MDGSVAIIDILLSLLTALFVFFGWQRGAVKELFSIALLLISFYVWDNYQSDIVRLLVNFTGQAPQWLAVVAFALVFLCALFVGALVETLLRPIATLRKEKVLKILGLIFGAYRLAVLCKAVIWLLSYQPFKANIINIDASFIYPVIKEIVPFLDDAPQLVF